MSDFFTQRIVRVLPEHVALLREMRAIWVPIEGGAPSISPESPYGSTDIPGDVRRILADGGFPT